MQIYSLTAGCVAMMVYSNNNVLIFCKISQIFTLHHFKNWEKIGKIKPKAKRLPKSQNLESLYYQWRARRDSNTRPTD
jgi:hypothetical protein